MGTRNTNRLLNEEARKFMNQFKFETATELGINMPQNGNMGDLPSRVNGSIGGLMTKKMVQAYQNTVAGTKPTE